MLKMLTKKKNQKGFTLLELMIVVAIIGILAAIVVPTYITAQANSRGAKILADLRTLDSAVISYEAANQGVAPTLLQLKPNYIAVVPTPPVGNALFPAGATRVIAAGDAYSIDAPSSRADLKGVATDTSDYLSTAAAGK